MRLLQPFVQVLFGLSLLVAGYSRAQDRPPEVTTSPESVTEAPAAPLITEERAAGERTGKSGMGGGMGGPGNGPPGYLVTWYPSQPVEDAASDFSLVRQSLSGAVPIWREGGDTLLFTAGVRNTLFFTDVILPDTQRPFPNELWNISVGLTYLHKFDNGWSAGLSTPFGSASDKPFHSIREMNIGFFGFLQVPARNERDSWMLSLMYSPVGNLTFPVPGLAYSWKPSDSFQMNIGIPFSVLWKPVNDLTLTFFYTPVINVKALATYRVVDGLNLYGGFEWLNEAYFLVDRADRNERFLSFEKRLVFGVRRDICPHAVMDLNAGYAFDRYYGEGQSQLSNLHDQVDISPGAFAGCSLLFKW